MSETITIFQIGDLHFDEFSKATTTNDVKDANAPGKLDAAFHRPLTPIIAQSLSNRIGQATNPAVAICGDLTSRGMPAVYDDALRYLSSILSSSGPLAVPASHIHLVPGNHDVDYYNSMPFVDLGSARFDQLAGRAAASGFPAPLTKSTRSERYKQNSAQVSFISLNSCRACGAVRELSGLSKPDLNNAIAAQLGITDDALTSAIKAAIAVVPSGVKDEILDVPLIHPDDYSQIISSISESDDKKTLPVLLAHHPFLPQAVNRISPYTEMVNGGQVREGLLQLGRPILYLHGHVHRDSVEILRGGPEAARDGGPLVAIAAPQLVDGFNEIRIEFSNDGHPLGLVLLRYRLSREDGQMRVLPEQRIPLARRRLVSQRLKAALIYMYESGSALGSDISARIASENPSPPVMPAELEEYMTRLTWLGIVEVQPDTASSPFPDREYVLI